MNSHSCILLFVLMVTAAQADTVDDEFNKFKVQYGIVYPNSNEELSRKSIFTKNYNTMKSHNEKFEKGEATYTMGTNQHSDKEPWEVPMGFLKNNPVQGTGDVQSGTVNVSSLPVSIDWREAGAVTPIKDQKQCGSCWTFSSTGAIEGRTKLKTGTLLTLSEQHLLDCAVLGNFGCNGGNMNNAFRYVKNTGGISSGADYPYIGFQSVCRSLFYKKVASITGYVQVKDGDEIDLQNATTTGPVSVGIHATNNLQLYKSGIFSDSTCDVTKLNHAVLVVGYGTDNGTDYWLVKNSWGTSWGEQGYVRMSRNNNNNCGIASMATYPTV